MRALALASALALLGCEPPPPPVFNHEVLFEVTSDVGDPVNGVRLFRPGAEIGTTGKDGQLTARFPARDGAQLTVSARCPEGHVDPPDTRIVLRELSAVAALAGGRRRVLIQCRRTRVVAAVVVRAGVADLPIMYEGEELTRTGPTGVAHVSAAVPPHETFSLSLDTSSIERLRPVDPTATFTMSAEDGFFVFDPALERLPEPRKPRKRRPKVRPPPEAPRPMLVPPNAHLGKGGRR